MRRVGGHVPDPRRWRVLSVLVVALFMSLVDVSIVNVALPSIQIGLGASDSQLQWVLSGYALTFGIGLVSSGRAGDLFGRGPLFIIGVGMFTLASAASGAAAGPLWLNISRAVQGIAAGLYNPQVIGMIQQYFRGAERARAFGIFGGAVGVSVAVGPLLGGLLIQAGGVREGWRWVFYVNLPVGILAIVLAALWIPRPLWNRRRAREGIPVRGADPGRLARRAGRRAPVPAADPDVAGRGIGAEPSPEADTDAPVRAGLAPAGLDIPAQSRNLDIVGAVLLGLAVLAVLFPFLQAQASALAWVALPVGVALVLVWLWWEGRYKRGGRSPMVDLAIFRVTSFANGTLLVSLYFLGMTSIWVLVALYLQEGLHETALDTGLIGLPSAVASGLAALWGGRNVTRYGRKVVIGGLYVGLAGVASSALVVWLQAEGLASSWWLLLTLGLVGVAQGSVISPNQALTLAEVPLAYAGSSGGVMQTGQRIGASVGIAVITAVAFAVLGVSDWSFAFIAGFAAIFVVLAVALGVGYVDLHQRHGDDWLAASARR